MTYFKMKGNGQVLAVFNGELYPPQGSIIAIGDKDWRIVGHFTELVNGVDGEGCSVTTVSVTVWVYYL